jgi:hypothetical protein
MAAYGTLVAWARANGHVNAATLLQQTLDEETAADLKLSELAESGLNRAADSMRPKGQKRRLRNIATNTGPGPKPGGAAQPRWQRGAPYRKRHGGKRGLRKRPE